MFQYIQSEAQEDTEKNERRGLSCSHAFKEMGNKWTSVSSTKQRTDLVEEVMKTHERGTFRKGDEIGCMMQPYEINR